MSDVKTNQVTFDSFGFKETIMQAVNKAGFKEPSSIQAKAIPFIMKGRDIIGQAHTGTGKTAAFGLPIIHKLNHNSGIECLVIAPTRELAMQVSEELYKLGHAEKTSVLTVYGGQPYTKQIDGIKRKPNIIVATPGRLLDLLKQKIFNNFAPHTVVLDEADEMLDMGFLEDIEKVFSYIDSEPQTLLFSATMPKPIKKLAESILKNPVIINVTDGMKNTVNENIKEFYSIIRNHERSDAVIRLIDSEDTKKAIVFCRTKSEVDQLNTHLIANGYPSGCLHGDMDQNQRQRTIQRFQGGKISILVATDVAARGLDIKNVSHVFNYHIPFEPELYLHRIGRTGRAGKQGSAITLVTSREYYKLRRFKNVLGGELFPCIVPTTKELREASTQNTLNNVLNQKINSLSENYIDQLIKEDSIENIAMKLLSIILEQDVILGPDQIGLSPEEVERVVADTHDHKDSSGRDGHRRGRSFKSRRRNKERIGSDKKNQSRRSRSNSDEKEHSSRPKRNRSDRKKSYNKD